MYGPVSLIFLLLHFPERHILYTACMWGIYCRVCSPLFYAFCWITGKRVWALRSGIWTRNTSSQSRFSPTGPTFPADGIFDGRTRFSSILNVIAGSRITNVTWRGFQAQISCKCTSQRWQCDSCQAVQHIAQSMSVISSSRTQKGRSFRGYAGLRSEPVARNESDFMATFLDGTSPLHVCAKLELHCVDLATHRLVRQEPTLMQTTHALFFSDDNCQNVKGMILEWLNWRNEKTSLLFRSKRMAHQCRFYTCALLSFAKRRVERNFWKSLHKSAILDCSFVSAHKSTKPRKEFLRFP